MTVKKMEKNGGKKKIGKFVYAPKLEKWRKFLRYQQKKRYKNCWKILSVEKFQEERFRIPKKIRNIVKVEEPLV